MKIGYARIANHEEHLAHQLDMLVAEGCEWLYTDNVSGVNPNKPALERAVEEASPGDCLVIWKLDRLGRAVEELVSLAEKLDENQMGFKSIGDDIDCPAGTGGHFFKLMSAIGRFQNHAKQERGAAASPAARNRHAMEPGSEKLSAEQWRAAKILIETTG